MATPTGHVTTWPHPLIASGNHFLSLPEDLGVGPSAGVGGNTADRERREGILYRGEG